MRIERINDNQIRCTLSKRDLAERHLKISELVYGSDKAKKLFRDMMEQAHMDYGFEAEDIPLMIEAIPTSRDSIVLLITKVDNPEEFEQRLSPFRNFPRDEEDRDMADDDDYYDSDAEDYDDENDLEYGEDDEEEEDEFDNDLFHSFEQLHEILEGETTKTENDGSSDFVPLHEMLKKGEGTKKPKKKNKDYAYSFTTFSVMTDASRAVSPLYHGKSCVWKDERNNTYYLILSKVENPSSMVHICSILNEFGKKERYTQANKEYYKEHYTLLISSNALEKLSKV